MCICVYVYMCICVYVYMCICVSLQVGHARPDASIRRGAALGDAPSRDIYMCMYIYIYRERER